MCFVTNISAGGLELFVNAIAPGVVADFYGIITAGGVAKLIVPVIGKAGDD